MVSLVLLVVFNFTSLQYYRNVRPRFCIQMSSNNEQSKQKPAKQSMILCSKTCLVGAGSSSHLSGSPHSKREAEHDWRRLFRIRPTSFSIPNRRRLQVYALQTSHEILPLLKHSATYFWTVNQGTFSACVKGCQFAPCRTQTFNLMTALNFWGKKQTSNF